MKSTRDGFGQGLVELGKRDERIVVLSADLTDSTRAGWFKKEFPRRFFSMGISEQDMISTAAGLALSGKIPFACTFGVFASGRAWDQIRMSVCSMNLNVKIAGSHGGISVGADGASHQALEEISLMRVLPHMTVLVPCDVLEAKKATIAAADIPGPVYLRLGRAPVAIATKEDEPFEIGKADIIKEGGDVTIISCGSIIGIAIEAVERLKQKGVEARLINLHTIKPIDKERIIDAASQTGGIITVEEHSIFGGMGGAVSEVVVQHCPVPMRMVGIEDTFGESGKPDELFEKYGLSVENIVKKAEEII